MISDVGMTLAVHPVFDFRRRHDVYRVPGGAAVVSGAVAVVHPLLPDAGYHGSGYHLLHHRNHHHRLHRRAPGLEEEAGDDAGDCVRGVLPPGVAPHRSGTPAETDGWTGGVLLLWWCAAN